MDFYEDGLYLVMLVAAAILVAVVITLMTKNMRKKKPVPAKLLKLSAGAGAQQASVAEPNQESVGKSEEQRVEQREERPKEVVAAKLPAAKPSQEAPPKLSQDTPENSGVLSIEVEEEEAESEAEDVIELSEVTSAEVEQGGSLMDGLEEGSDLMNIFQSVEDDNSELAELAARLPDVDLESVKVLSDELSLALAKRAAKKKEE